MILCGWTNLLTRESRIDSRLRIRGGSVESGRFNGSGMACLEGVVAGRARGGQAQQRPSAPGQPQHYQWHSVATTLWHRMARCAGGVRQLELDLPAFPPMDGIGYLGERVHSARRADGGERPLQHRLHLDPRPCLGSGRKRGFIDDFAARGAGSPVKFIVSVMPEAGRSPSTSRRAKRTTAKPTTC